MNEHVWDDANVDWYFGDYSALGPKPYLPAFDPWGNPDSARGSAEDERDLYYTYLGDGLVGLPDGVSHYKAQRMYPTAILPRGSEPSTDFRSCRHQRRSIH